MPKRFAYSSGFTLIELLIVIAIIGILAVGLVLAINPFAQIQKANDAKRKSDLEQIQKALEQYYSDNNSYPLSTGASGNPPYSITGAPFGSSWGTYMQIVPQDPTNGTSGKTYAYSTTNGGQTYYLYTSLDYVSDPQACQPSGSKCPNAPGTPACGPGAKCTFGLTSSDTTP